MSMSIREMTALERESRSREQLAESYKTGGAEAKKNAERLEKAAGGKAKIDKADAILEKAENDAHKIIEAGNAEASDVVAEAVGHAAAIEQGLTDREIAVTAHGATNAAKALVLGDREKDAETREAEIKKGDTRQLRAANALTKREADLTEREANLAQAIADLEAKRAVIEDAMARTAA